MITFKPVIKITSPTIIFNNRNFYKTTLKSSDENNPALVAFIGGKLAIHWADRTEGDMRNSVISHLADCLGSWVYQYTDVTIKNWAKEQFIEGSPVTVPKCGTMEWWPALRETHQRKVK